MKTIACPALVVSALLAGCAAAPTVPSVMVLPGTSKTAAQFNADDAACRQQAHAQVAPQAEAANTQAVGTAVVGTALGAAVGALLGAGSYYPNNAVAWGAGTGLMMGGAVGGSQSLSAGYGLQQRYDTSFIQCMYAHGHQVPARAAYRQMPPARPAPRAAPPSYPPPGTPAPNIPPPNTLPPV